MYQIVLSTFLTMLVLCFSLGFIATTYVFVKMLLDVVK